MQKRSLLVLFFAFISLMHCVTAEKTELTWGVQPGYKDFIPARIAVLSCRLWPKVLSVETAEQIKDFDLQKICKKFNEEVLNAFRQQPFMNGFTPQKIAKLLTDTGKPDHLALLEQSWQQVSADRLEEISPLLFYKEKIQNSSQWLLWLNEFSKSTEYCDAILLPLIVSGYEKKWDERGLLHSQRSLFIAPLLIDTNTASIIWGQGRLVKKDSQKLAEAKEELYPEAPPWEALYSQAFVSSLWRDFPGRIIR